MDSPLGHPELVVVQRRELAELLGVETRNKYELRTAAEDEVSYLATAPRALRTDRVSNALMELEPSGKGAIEWDEKSKDKVPK